MTEQNKMTTRFGTQDQAFFPAPLLEKFHFVKEMGFHYFEMDGGLLVRRTDEVKEAVRATGIQVWTACNGYEGWIGDFDETKRKQAVKDISDILYALKEVGGKGIVVPAAWGMFTYRLPPMTPPRSQKEDWEAVSDSLKTLEKTARETGTYVYLEPLNRYQDHMINTVMDACRYIEANELQHVKIAADFYHMNIEEDDIPAVLHEYRETIHHIHLADNHRFQPGSGALNFQPAFRQLAADGYEGLLVFETRIRAEDEQQAYRDSLAYMKALADTEEQRMELRKHNGRLGKGC